MRSPPPENNKGDAQARIVKDGSIHVIIGGPHIGETIINLWTDMLVKQRGSLSCSPFT